MEAFAGLDISLHTTHICIVDAEGKPIHEGVASSDPGSVDEWLRDHSKGLTIRRLVFETGQLSTHFYHGLRSSWPVICIDARHAHGTLKAQRVKTDKNDARGLAQISRTGWYKAVHVKSPQGQLRLRAWCGWSSAGSFDARAFRQRGSESTSSLSCFLASSRASPYRCCNTPNSWSLSPSIRARS